MRVSIIIPTLNEAKVVEKTLARIARLAPHEIIVGDGGSLDGTLDIAAKYASRIVTAPRGRAAQMNAAAQAAAGDALVFLHADSAVEPAGYAKMVEALRRGNIVGGAFSLRIESDKLSLNLISILATWRAKRLHLAYGDQAIFVRRDVFGRIGGFSPLPICEDLDFFRKLRKEGGVVILDEKAVTSPRRWQKEGVFLTTFRNAIIAGLFLLGCPPKFLSKWYLSVR
ncbi:MAG: TIGR04283 family arsenosugar biosynthesis glycosyltransferase [Nitrospinae bacterium]|nr:TIGR04283 family arsenosugar biosynthesis glycosyltransferase [Nitrospinota bacterium]